MELKKVIIDGREYYEAKDAEEKTVDSEPRHDDKVRAAFDGAKEFGSKVADKAKEIGVKTAEGAKELGLKVADKAKEIGVKTADGAKEFGAKVKEDAKDFCRGAKDFGGKVKEKTKDIGAKTAEGAKNLGEKVVREARDAGHKIKEGAERLFSKDRTLDPDSKEAKLIKLLPYMNRKETHEVAELLLNNDGALSGVDLSAILPFLSGEDCNAIFLGCVRLGRRDLDLATVMQFVDKAALKEVVDGYLNGEYPKLDIDSFYPFLDDEDIKRIFNKIIAE